MFYRGLKAAESPLPNILKNLEEKALDVRLGYIPVDVVESQFLGKNMKRSALCSTVSMQEPRKSLINVLQWYPIKMRIFH